MGDGGDGDGDGDGAADVFFDLLCLDHQRCPSREVAAAAAAAGRRKGNEFS